MKRLQPALVGILLAVLTAFVVTRIPERQAVELLAAVLVAAATVYAGAALGRGERGPLVLETVVMVVFVAFALAGLWGSVIWLAAGYAAHGLWDLLHHPHRVGASAGSWFPPFCLVYDWAVALFILVTLR